MPLAGSHWVWGYLLNVVGDGIVGVTIQVLDATSYQGTGTVVTGAGGYFQINVQDYVDDGNTLIVTTTVDAFPVTEFLTISLDELTQNVTLQVGSIDSDNYAISYVLGDSRIYISTSLPRPYYAQPNNTIQFDTTVHNFWDKSLDVNVDNLAGDEVNIRGWETRGKINALAHTIKDVINEGRVVGIHFLGDKLDGDYIVKSFKVETIRGVVDILDYELTLEPIRGR